MGSVERQSGRTAPQSPEAKTNPSARLTCVTTMAMRSRSTEGRAVLDPYMPIGALWKKVSINLHHLGIDTIAAKRLIFMQVPVCACQSHCET